MRKGSHHTREAIKKNRIAHLRENLSDETLRKLRLANSSKHPSKESNEKRRLAMLGRHHTEEAKRKCRIAHLGRHHTEEAKEKMRIVKSGKNNGNWLGGLSFEPYAPEFNRQLKELIRQRDGYQCQLCGMPEIENIQRLTIHHIDYVKKNCLPDNLITLCKGCNNKVNSNRDYWEEYFKEKILEKAV